MRQVGISLKLRKNFIRQTGFISKYEVQLGFTKNRQFWITEGKNVLIQIGAIFSKFSWNCLHFLHAYRGPLIKDSDISRASISSAAICSTDERLSIFSFATVDIKSGMVAFR